MNLAAGTRLGPYEITAPLGAGGMGEVFRARDGRLGRDVAIKALPDAFAGDPERLARFEREARLLASLSHPQIAGIHGLEEVEGRRYLVLEFVEGETLGARLARGPLPVLEALQVCTQIAAAVEAAHEAGVIHRDLKPGNVMLRPDGAVKVLDFGLAKSGVTMSSGSDPNLSASPTMTYAATSMGVVLGTAAYMSPEQARGKPVDRRTDIWSFGCVLYECLTGRQCFAGETLSDTIAMILQKDPDWHALPSRTPRRVRDLLARCLERDAKKRLRDAGEARIALESSIAGLESGTELSIESPAPGATRSRALPLLLAIGTALGAVLGLFAGRMIGGGGGSATPVAYVSIAMPRHRELVVHDFLDFPIWDVSDDGSRLVVNVRRAAGQSPARLFWRRMSDADWTPIEGSDHAIGFPVFAHDGRTVFFASENSSDQRDVRLMRYNTETGGTPVAVCDLPPEARAFIPFAGGRFVFIHSNGTQIALREPNANGGVRWQTVDRGAFTGGIDATTMSDCPQLGDDQVFVGTTVYAHDGWHRGTAILDVSRHTLTPLLEDGQWPAYHPSGVLLFSRGSTILATRFDIKSKKLRGEAVPLMDGVRARGDWLPGRFRLTIRGDLVSAPGGATGSQRTLEWLNIKGEWSLYTTETRAYSSGILGATPDGRRIAVTVTNSRGFDEVWTFDGDDHTGQRALAEEGWDVGRAVVSRDGNRLAYHRNGMNGVNMVMVSGFAGEPAPRTVFGYAVDDSALRPFDWFPDNRHLICVLDVNRNARRLAILDADAPGHPTNILPEYEANNPLISPDGRFLAFDSDRTGRKRIYVCGISPQGVTSAPVPVTRSGEIPSWLGSGGSLLYGDSTCIRQVDVNTAGGIVAGADRLLFDVGAAARRVQGGAVLPDGRELLVMAPPEEGNLVRLDLVQNWWSSIQSKLPR